MTSVQPKTEPFLIDIHSGLTLLIALILNKMEDYLKWVLTTITTKFGRIEKSMNKESQITLNSFQTYDEFFSSLLFFKPSKGFAWKAVVDDYTQQTTIWSIK